MKKTGWSGPWIHGPEPTWHFLHREPELLTMVNFSSCEMMVVVPVLHCPRLLSTPVSDTLPAHLGLPSPKTVHSFGSNVCRPPSEELMSSSLCALTELSTLLPKHFFFFTFFFLSAGWLADIFSHQNQMPWGQIQHFIFYLQSFVEGLQYSKCSTNNCWITTPVNRETC